MLDRAPQMLRSDASRVSPLAIGPWQLTALLHQGRLNVFRARPADGSSGPGCYVIKVGAATANGRLALAMLGREVAVADSVQHHHLISVLASRLHERAKPFIVMPYVEGLSLAQLQAASSAQQLPIAFALWIIRQIAEALSALHTAGWLHGQVRPEHVVVSPQGHATLLDLSFARRLETDECAATTHPPESLLYAAPEAFSPRSRLTPATDVYCLGLLLFELLTGQTPFAELDRKELADAHQHAAPPDLHSLRPDAPHDLATLLRLFLAKQPLRRPGADELVQWLTELEIAALSA